MTTTIMIGSAKGGVGKSTTATSQAMILANKGHNVLLIDFDAQANSTTYCGVQQSHGLYNLLVKGAEFDQVAVEVDSARFGGNGKLWVVPTSDGSNYKIAEDIQDEMVVPDRFSELNDMGIDYCIVDTTPATSKVHFGFMFAAQWIIIPSQCQMWSIQGAKTTWRYVREVHKIAQEKRLNAAGIFGFLPTLFDQRKRIQKDAYELMQQQFGALLLPPIHYAKEWEEAVPNKLSVVEYKSRSRAAREALALTDLVLAKQE